MNQPLQQSLTALPILNLSQFDQSSTQADFLQRLAHIAKDIGFFYLTGHGISAEKISEIQRITRQFFSLPQEQKDEIAMIHSPHFRGYSRVNAEVTRLQPDFREQIDIGFELAALEPETGPTWRRLQGPNQWPSNWPEFQRVVTAWQRDLRQVAIKLLKTLLLSLGQQDTALDQLITGSPHELLKLIHYPPIDQMNHQGVGPHKDSNILTLLLQDQIGGLQVLSQGKWIEVPFVEHAFVVNIGEVLELATNGYLIANQHRVISPTNADRYSVAYFLSPNLFAGEIPLLNLADNLKALAQGPETDPLNPLLRNVGENCIKGRLRSHLDVTEKYYPAQFKQLQQSTTISSKS